MSPGAKPKRKPLDHENPHIPKFKKGKSKNKKQQQIIGELNRPENTEPKIPVPIKEMTMNKLNFGDIIFGGNVQQNIDKEATMNRIINRQLRTKKINKDLFGTTGGNQEVIPTPLRKHMVKKSNQPLTQIFTKVQPK